MKFYLILSLVIISLIACTNDEKIINNVSVHQKFLISTKGDNPKLILYDSEDKIISNDLYNLMNEPALSSPITKLKEYGGKIFCLIPSEHRIDIIDKDSLYFVKKIDFSSSNLEPTDICFANSTDAYICHGNDSVVTLFDMFNLENARTIKVGKHPVSIASAGNQIFVTNQADNTVSIIDSRTHEVEKVINLHFAPSFVETSGEWEKAVVVSLGQGKLDSNQTKSEARVSFIDVASKELTNVLDLQNSQIPAKEQYPIDFILTKYDWAFILTKTNLLRVDVRREKGINTISDKSYDGLMYSGLRNVILIINNAKNEIRVSNASTASLIYTINLESNISSVFMY